MSSAQFVSKFQNSGKQYDYIFGDLTDIPVTSSPRSKLLWEFLENIIVSSLRLLKPDQGKYMTHCNGKNSLSAIEAFEKMLDSLTIDGEKLSFERRESFVPSFLETWMFYTITRI